MLGTAEGVEHLAPRLDGSGWAVARVSTVRAVAIRPALWRIPPERIGEVSDVVVTSPHGVSSGVRVWQRATHPSGSVRYWAVGPSTQAALRGAGVPRARRARVEGASALARAMGRGRGSVLRLRSDRAGPALARRLREQGHRVTDLVTYRTLARSRMTVAERRAVEEADLLFAASPSAVLALGPLLGRGAFLRIRQKPVATLGERSARAIRRAGFSRVRVVGPTTQRFTRRLLDGEFHGSEGKE